MGFAYDYGYQGKSLESILGGMTHANLEGNYSQYLSPEQSRLVAAFMGTGQGGYNREWEQSNPGEFWNRRYGEANSWYRALQDEYSQGSAKRQSEEMNARQKALSSYMSELEKKYGQDEMKRYQGFIEQMGQQSSAFQQAMDEMLGAQKQAQVAQQEAETRRQAEEYQNRLSQFELATQGLTNTGLTTDADSFEGEMGQFSSYWDEVADQLGDAGYDINQVMGDRNYAQDLGNLRTGASNIQTNYSNFLGGLSDNEALMEQYGTPQALTSYGTNLRDQYQTQYDQYSNQINELLGNVGSIYQAYSKVGDLDQALGNTVQEKLGYLTGLGTTPDFSSIDNYYNEFTNDYNEYANKLASLYKTESPTQYEGILSKYTNQLTGMGNELTGAKNQYLNQYQDATNQLHSLFGNVDAVTSGMFGNTANQLKGELATGANSLSSLLGNQENALLDLQDLYESTVSQLTSQRLGEKQSIVSQRSQNKANRSRNRALSNVDDTTRAKTLGLSGLLDDNLGLTRGYSLLGQ